MNMVEVIRFIGISICIYGVVISIIKLINLKKYNIGGVCPYFPGCSDMTDYGVCGRNDGNKRCPYKSTN